MTKYTASNDNIVLPAARRQ